MDLCMEIRERFTHIAVELAHACFVGRHVWLRCVVDEVVREEFFEDVKSAFSLNLFGISAHHSFRCIGRSYGIHTSTVSGLEGVLDAPGLAPRDFSAMIAICNPCSVCKIAVARSPITTHGAIVLPVVPRGITEASAIRKPLPMLSGIERRLR